MSRPRSSVPRTCPAAKKGSNRFEVWISFGASSGKTGASKARHSATINASMPATAKECPRATFPAVASQPRFENATMDGPNWPLGVTDPWIQVAVQEVHREAHGDERQRGKQDRTLHEREIAALDPIEHHASNTRPGEYAFDDDRPAQQIPELEPHHRDHRDHGILQSVTNDDQAFAQPLRARRAHIVAPHDLEHRR